MQLIIYIFIFCILSADVSFLTVVGQEWRIHRYRLLRPAASGYIMRFPHIIIEEQAEDCSTSSNSYVPLVPVVRVTGDSTSQSALIKEFLNLQHHCVQMRERMPLRYSLSWIRPMAKTFLPASLREAPQ